MRSGLFISESCTYALDMTEQNSRSSYVVLVSLVVALGGFLMGFDNGVIGGVLGPMTDHFELTPGQQGWAVSCLTAGAAIAMAIAGPMADRFGRRTVLMVTALLFTVSALASALAPTFEILWIARIIGGFGVGGALLIAPMYIAEIAPPDQRGKLVSFNQLNIVLGFLAAFFSNYFIHKSAGGSVSGESWLTPESEWRLMLGIELVPAALYFLLLLMVPKSPRWLAAQGRESEALEVLVRANGRASAEEALRGVNESLAKAANMARARLKDLFSSKMSRIMLIGLGLGFFQQITGINAIFYYATAIFELTGEGRDAALLSNIVVGVVNVVFTLIALRLIDRAGRRPLLLFGTAMMAIALLTNAACFRSATFEVPDAAVESISQELGADAGAAYGTLQGQVFDDQLAFAGAVRVAAAALPAEKSTELEGKIQDLAKGALNINGILVLIAICTFIAGFAISLGPVMWAMFSEIFPMHMRGLAISVAGFVNSAVSYLVQQLFPVGMDSLGPAFVFGIFGSFAVGAFFFTLFVVPETKGKSLEELEELLVRN